MNPRSLPPLILAVCGLATPPALGAGPAPNYVAGALIGTTACKWRLHPDLVALLEEWVAQPVSSMDTRPLSRGRGQPLAPPRCWFGHQELADLLTDCEKACPALFAA